MAFKLWQNGAPSRGRVQFIQRRVSATVDHLRPHRWNWSAVAQPLDRRLAHQADDALPAERIFSLRYLWIDGLFTAVGESFYLGFIPLFALAYGASNGQVGWLTAVSNLLGALALFPGARLIERVGQRKRIVLWSAGGVGRLALLGLSLLPLLTREPTLAIFLIITFGGIHAFVNNFSNPAWTAMVADLVPDVMRGRYFSSRNMVMGIAALLVAPIAGYFINQGNLLTSLPFLGYQTIFFLAFLFGMIGTYAFSRIKEPPMSTDAQQPHQPGDMRRLWREAKAFRGFVISAFVWNLSLQVAAPFFNIYLTSELQATTTVVGILASVSSLSALFGQQLFGRLLDKKGAYWVQTVCGFIIPLLPFAWIFITSPWQVVPINLLGGFVWAGYTLSNFSLLLALTPDAQRPRAVALYQTAVFSSAVLGPLLGGWIADLVSFKLIFGLSFGGRLVGMLLFVWLTLRLRPKQIQAN